MLIHVRCIACCVLMAGAPAFGQAVSGSLLGVVTDNSDSSVPGATVSILEVNTGVSRMANTSESGNYVFPDLAPGTYTVAAPRKERTGLLQMVIPPIEAIATVDVSTSNFEAELGRAIGAVTNVILKSGTNTFHGAGYEFLKNSALNARNFFDPAIGHVAYNYFGG